MRYVSSMAVLLVASLFAVAAPPEISSPKEVYGQVGDWVEVTVTSTGKWVRYKSFDSSLKVFPSELLKDPKRILVSSLEAKTYKLLAYTGNEEGGADTEVIVTFVQKGINPPGPNPPTPTPNPPTPTPNPVPVVLDGAWLIVVEETMQRTPETAQVLGDINFWKALPVAGVKFYDPNSPDAKKYKYDVMAQQTGIPLPVMMIVDKTGKLVKASKLATETSQIRQFVKENTGK